MSWLDKPKPLAIWAHFIVSERQRMPQINFNDVHIADNAVAQADGAAINSRFAWIGSHAAIQPA